ncbi:NAD(P)/FAD-dependent oxidoreductase [Pseudanabaena sp. PCC 6802]|uniref:NAD(P)/FAD-dependent oxidoreductase n=1 Tax=Pseudanabaena sp. PCC 6802 TaxID=118173 RepID=UPI0003487A88|nr:FAD-dependent oxidoreductase [Pseudanabaena sp. PCC 6802]
MTCKNRVVVVGCGVIGATIAYELSRLSLPVQVIEARSQPGMGATGAALGVLMAACAQKPDGDLVALRLASLRRYDRLIAALITETGWDIPYNRAGILSIYADPDAQAKWSPTILARQAQGFSLKWLDRSALRSQYPLLAAEGGTYSESDRALNPAKLVQALVQAAQQNGAKFIFSSPVERLSDLPDADWIVITAGLGSDRLLDSLNLGNDEPLLMPVGGQAIEIYLPGLDVAQVIHAVDLNGSDINIVPLGQDRYWVGATVEFDPQDLPREANVAKLLATASQFCPLMQQAKVLQTWAGDRPRPRKARSPILGFVPGHPNVLVAIGHYRNGILMAPISAQIICDLIVGGDSDLPWRGCAVV